MAIVFLVLAFIINAFASVFLKLNTVKGVGFKNVTVLSLITGNIYLWLALFLFAANVVFYYLALRAIPLSVAYPVMVVGTFLIVSASSILVFKESLNGIQIIGYILVIVGITLVSYFTHTP
jgi:multidrug transporter EmrE-like cation transporter